MKPQLRAFFEVAYLKHCKKCWCYSTCSPTELCGILLTCSPVPHSCFFCFFCFFNVLLWFHSTLELNRPSDASEMGVRAPSNIGSVIRIRGDSTWISARRRNRRCFLLYCVLQKTKQKTKKNNLRGYFSDLSGPQRTESSKCGDVLHFRHFSLWAWAHLVHFSSLKD